MKLVLNTCMVSLFLSISVSYAGDSKPGVNGEVHSALPSILTEKNNIFQLGIRGGDERGPSVDLLFVSDEYGNLDHPQHGGLTILGHVGPELTVASLGGSIITYSKDGKAQTTMSGSILAGVGRINDQDGNSIIAWQPLSAMIKHQQQIGEKGKGQILDIQADAGYLINAQWNAAASVFLLPVPYPEHIFGSGFVYHLKGSLTQQLGETMSIGAYAVYEGGSSTPKIDAKGAAKTGQVSAGVKVAFVID